MRLGDNATHFVLLNKKYDDFKRTNDVLPKSVVYCLDSAFTCLQGTL